MFAKIIFVLQILLFIGIKFSCLLEIGDKCDVLDRSGVCTLDTECKSFKHLSYHEKQTVFQKKCSFQGTSAVICCFDLRKSKLACDNLEPRPRKGRIIDGKDALIGDFPQFAALGYIKYAQKPMTFDCGGVLISRNFVLTAAQCLNSSMKSVTLGTVALKAGVNLLAYLGRLQVNVKDQFIHPDYSSVSRIHDIGLVELQTDVIYTFKVWPACLHQDEDLGGKVLEIAGFGVTDDLGITSDLMGKAEVNEVSLDECSEAFQKIPDFRFQKAFKNGLLCAKSVNKTSNTCKGDEGSGLSLKPVNKTKDKRVVVGVTSFGVNCDPQNPAVYTRVSQHLDWIESVVWL